MKATSKRAELRLSQLVTTFGPGAMIDLPTRSVIVGGLERWDMQETTWRKIIEPRAERLLQDRLKDRIAPGRQLQLRTPPLNPQLPGREPPGVAVTVFPTWFVADRAELSGSARRRRLVSWKQLDPSGGRRRVDLPEGKSEVRPIRFVAACKHGHIQDIDWTWVVHGAERCSQPLWLEEQGTTGEPRNTRIVCDCGKSLSLSEAQNFEGRLGKCSGRQPWLEINADGCDQFLKFLTRTATNTYFPQVLTVISLPAHEDELTRLVGEHWDALKLATSLEDVIAVRKFNPPVGVALESHSDATVFDAVRRFHTAVVQDLDRKPKFAEFDILGSGAELIGENAPDAKLHAETLQRAQWGGDEPRLKVIDAVVAVHRLREVSCLYGFTRFEAAPISIDGDIEEIFIDVDGAPIASELSWLPAIEQFGEGVFLRFDPAALTTWLSRPGPGARAMKLLEAFEGWAESRTVAGKPPRYPGPAYTMLHSLSHALMTEIALECGYPSTSLKERVYALVDAGDAPRYGLLIYTATTGAQGTLGGLLAIIPRLGEMLLSLLDKLSLCSSDPICADHNPALSKDDRALHGAACHSCLLVAETSCENRNLYLDRALVCATIALPDAGCFQS